jgi:diacylglycerol kinase (ATP)
MTLALSVPVSFWISPDPVHRALLIASLIIVVVVELLNTGIEKLCDLVQPTTHPSVKAVKDMGSAAVLSAVGAAFLLWAVTLWERLV